MRTSDYKKRNNYFILFANLFCIIVIDVIFLWSIIGIFKAICGVEIKSVMIKSSILILIEIAAWLILFLPEHIEVFSRIKKFKKTELRFMICCMNTVASTLIALIVFFISITYSEYVEQYYYFILLIIAVFFTNSAIMGFVSEKIFKEIISEESEKA